uniref:hypothetical protein n=1 Tax=Piscinibacter sakaiensis TaxID=1547922 RepID=UPI00372D75B1
MTTSAASPSCVKAGALKALTPGIGRPTARVTPWQRHSSAIACSSASLACSGGGRASGRSPSAASTAAKARPVAVPSSDITVPARMLTCSGWRASIMRTTVGPKLPQTASATARPVEAARASATGVAERGQPDAQRRRPERVLAARGQLHDQAQLAEAHQVGVGARGRQAGGGGQVLQRHRADLDGLHRALGTVELGRGGGHAEEDCAGACAGAGRWAFEFVPG